MNRPDLLYDVAPPAASSRALSQAITFGFARGVDESQLLHAAAPAVADSYFHKDSFASDLFLSELIQGSFPLIVRGRRLEAERETFLRVLLGPPKSLSDTWYRQEIFRELGKNAERRAQVEEAYLSVRAFREALAGSEHVGARTAGVQRRIDILVALRRALDQLLAATGSSRTGLERIATWVEGVQKGDAYQALERLLAFEEGRSVLETRLQVGYDGNLRRFEISRVSEVSHGAFSRGPVSRFFRRVISLLKGYRFSEEDVMSQLLDRVFSDLESEVHVLLELSLSLEFYLRGLSFQDCSRGENLQTCLPTILPKGSDSVRRELLGLFNPWLAAQKGVQAVPCDLVQEDARKIIIVTGPNSGGKTRLMQSLAVTQLLAQVGLPVPAREATVVEVEQLFLSLLEQAEPDQSEGRLGSELMRIRQVFETSGPHSLVIMDELCSGTNPSEGERIFEMVLGLLEELGPQVLITTHFLDFATRLSGLPSRHLEYLQVELSEGDTPTYQFVPGVAATSLARNTAARLGVTHDELHGLIVHRKQLATRSD